MSATRLFVTLVGCSLAALGAPIPGRLILSSKSSTSSQTVDNPLSVTQNLFSTQIVAQGPGGQVVFDQSLNFAFADPAVQALVAQATLALNGIGATSILGPNLTSSTVVFEGSSVATSLTGSREDTYEVDGHIGGVITFGPAVLTVGALTCQSFAITNPTPRTDPNGVQFAGIGVPGGCAGGTQLVLSDTDSNINVWWHILTTNFQDVITTDTFRTREVYLLQARDGGSAAAEVPEPGTLGMLLAAAPVFFALRRRNRGAS